jgi:hypothetical protein
MAVVRFDGQGNDLARTWVDQSDTGVPVPRWDIVTPAAPTLFGLWNPASTPQLAHYPKAWTVCVQFGGGFGTTATIEALLPARTGRHGKVLRPSVKMVLPQAIDGFEEINPEKRIGVCGAYLARVAEFFDGLPAYVYGNGPLDPLVFCKSSEIHTKADLIAGPGFAIVMPMRV